VLDIIEYLKPCIGPIGSDQGLVNNYAFLRDAYAIGTVFDEGVEMYFYPIPNPLSASQVSDSRGYLDLKALRL